MTTEEIFRGLSLAQQRFKDDGKVHQGFFFQPEWEALDEALTVLAKLNQLLPEEYEGTYYCRGCKSPVLKTDKFCHECGRPINWYNETMI